MASSKVLIGPGFYITYIIPGPGTLDIVFGFNLVFEGVSQGGQQDACFDGVEGTNTTDCNDGQGSFKHFKSFFRNPHLKFHTTLNRGKFYLEHPQSEFCYFERNRNILGATEAITIWRGCSLVDTPVTYCSFKKG